jgi:hypothetical protein
MWFVIEIAHAQYYAWALTNRDALLPSRRLSVESWLS